MMAPFWERILYYIASKGVQFQDKSMKLVLQNAVFTVVVENIENCLQSDAQEPQIQGSGCSGSINFTFCKKLILSRKSERLSSKMAPIGLQNASLEGIQGARGAGFGAYNRAALLDWRRPCPRQPFKQNPPPLGRRRGFHFGGLFQEGKPS